MHHWLEHDIVATGRLPLLFFYLGFIGGFAFIRFSVRMIRADVRWWPGNVTPGGHHIHHMVFGTIAVLISGVTLIGTYVDGSSTTGVVLATIFGVGAALILDEFALMFYLKDVYWSDQGRTSVEAVFVAIAVTGLVLLGFHPLSFLDVGGFREAQTIWARIFILAGASINLGIAAVVILKGKIWTALLGMFVLPVMIVGAIRLSRPGAPWARWRYAKRPKRMDRAVRRERRLRRPVMRVVVFLQDLIAGKPSVEHARSATEEQLDKLVRPAPPPPEHGL